MASIRQNRYSVCAVRNRNTGAIVTYLSQRDIDQCADINYDLLGYEVISL